MKEDRKGSEATEEKQTEIVEVKKELNIVEEKNDENQTECLIGDDSIPPSRTVELTRDPQWNLGISIVGGRQQEGDDPRFKGIFIKHVLETCPAGKSGLLKTGDQILKVQHFNS